MALPACYAACTRDDTSTELQLQSGNLTVAEDTQCRVVATVPNHEPSLPPACPPPSLPRPARTHPASARTHAPHYTCPAAMPGFGVRLERTDHEHAHCGVAETNGSQPGEAEMNVPFP